jgi:hypothetical protein|tara:strand:+ start:1623 stop:2036 length:414 start_codon:yes stop_codon:yes gene_type:complete
MIFQAGNRIDCLHRKHKARQDQEGNNPAGSVTCGNLVGVKALEAVKPVADLTVGLFAFNAIGFLNQANQFFLLAFDLIKIIVGEAAPFALDVTTHLFPTAFNLVPIHQVFSCFFRVVCSFGPEILSACQWHAAFPVA